MGPEVRSDEDLLSARDGATFELFYRRYADRMLGYFVRRRLVRRRDPSGRSWQPCTWRTR